jgi:diguanylate cyclase (GGDEF)-like protein/PAS domain S-box-containing protein
VTETNIELAASLERARAELAALAGTHDRLLEAEETLRAIHHGEVDALVVRNGAPGDEVFTLSSADRPYRIFVENMREGAATVSDAGIVLFANERFGELLGCPAADLVARPLTDVVTEASRHGLVEAMSSGGRGTTVELALQGVDGSVIAALAGVSRLDVEGEQLTCLTFTDLTAEHRLLDEIRASQQRFEALYKGAPVPAYTWQDSPSGLVLIGYNDAAAHLTGGLVQTMLWSRADTYYRGEPELQAHMTRCLTDQEVVECSSVSPALAGRDAQHLQITMVPVPPDLVVVHTQDVTESWLAERALRASEVRYRTIVENAHEGIGILDRDGRFTFANPRTAELLGYEVAKLAGMLASRLLGPTVTQAHVSSSLLGATQYEVRVVRPDGTDIDLLVSTAPILAAAGGESTGSLCMLSDVSGLRHAEQKLAHWALHDPLTGLPNRTLLVDRIDQALNRQIRNSRLVAALFCDVDNFKDVNDSHGHHVGDEVLKAVAARLCGAVRPTDTVARIGGDEFVVLSEDMDESGAFELASRVLLALAAPLDVAGHELSLSASVGVAFANSTDPAELLRNADAAMYLAKQRGRNRAELFDERLRQVAADRISLIGDLRHAVERDELRVHYQPVFSLDGESLVGVEALVRWQHPRRGLVYPLEFVPAAESANLIGEIGAWVLRTACHQAAAWAHAGTDGAPLQMAVNVSARQLAQGGGLVQLVADAVNDSGIDPSTLVLEVTESVVMDDAEATLSILTELKALRVQLAIDDFGTGYSSLVYLKRFPVDQLKVDRSFVRGLGTDPDDSAIVASVIGLAHAVGIVTIAEGVETGQQLAALQQLGCGYGQGFIWSRPLPAPDLDRLIRSGKFPRRGATSPPSLISASRAGSAA